MTAAEIHKVIQSTRADMSTETIERLLDALTMLNDRVTEVERKLMSAQATARHADESVGAMSNGLKPTT